MRRPREQAIDAQADALDAFYIGGIRHNIPFLSALMAHPRWRAGTLSTGFIAEEFPDGFHGVRAARRDRACAGGGRDRDRPCAGRAQAADFRVRCRTGWSRASGSARCWLNETEYKLEVTRANGIDRSRVSRRWTICTSCNRDWKPGDPVWSGTVDGKPVTVQVSAVPNGFDLSFRGAQARAFVYTESEAAYARLMPVKKAADTGKLVALSDAGPRGLDRGQGRAGGQGRRDPRGGRGHEDGKRAARRTRRHREDRSTPSPATASRSMP